jgi:molybdenum cofactor synthesis domain-containing protein
VPDEARGPSKGNTCRGFRAAVLVVSDGVTEGTRVDRSGPAAQEILRGWGADVVRLDVVPDDAGAISAALTRYADADRLDFVVTSGGTGLSPLDVTPEATAAVLDRLAPGLSELLRRETARHTPFAALGRGTAGVRGKTLIVNLPGSPKGVAECLEVLRPLVPHAVRLARGDRPDHEFPAAP